MTTPVRLASTWPASRLGVRGQRGNALVFALLGLVVTSLTSIGYVRGKAVDQRSAAGASEATILDSLRAATNAAIYEQVVELQAGNPLTKGGRSVPPAFGVGGELVWRPTPDDLAAMGYLPTGWTASRSTLNGATYQVTFSRLPAGCSPAACSIEGHVVIGGSIPGNSGEQMDSVVISPILTRIGADSGVSLVGTAAEITGFANTWRTSNPVVGAPAGVVAVRVGTASAGFSQFVRLSDARDPNLRGNLSVGGNTSIGGTLTVVGNTTVLNASVTFKNADGTDCIRLLPDGTVDVLCAGQLNATNATLAGNLQAVLAKAGTVESTGEVTAAGAARSNRWQPTGLYAAGSPCTEPNALASNASAAGLVLCSGGAWRPVLTQAQPGDACSPDGTFASADGVALICTSGKYSRLDRFIAIATGGDACRTAGATATDATTGSALLCRANPSDGALTWYELNDLVSNYSVVRIFSVSDGTVIPKPRCSSGAPGLQLIPLVEGSSDGAFNRYVVDSGSAWTVYLRDATGAELGGATVQTSLYCFSTY